MQSVQLGYDKLKNKHFTHYKYYPWLVITLCAGLLFYKYVLTVSPSIMTDQLMHQFQVNGTGLGVLAASFAATCMITQLFVGILLDRFSPRWFAAIAVAVSAFGTYVFAKADVLWVAVLARSLMGFGAAFATVTYLKMTVVWFRPNQLAFVGGLLATAVMLGAVFGQAPLAYLVEHIGWRASLLDCSILGFTIAVFFVLCVRDQPRDLYSTQTGKNNKIISALDVWHFLKQPQNWLLFLHSGLAFAPLDVFGGLWGNPFLREAYQLTQAQAGTLIGIMFIGLGVGSPLLGFLSDRLNKRVVVMKFGLILSIFSFWPVIYLPSLPLWMLTAFLFLFGFGTGAFMLGFTLGRLINQLALAATVVAFINTGDTLMSVFSEPFVGKLLDLEWSGQAVAGIRYFDLADYHVAFLPLLIYLAVALFVLFFIKEAYSLEV